VTRSTVSLMLLPFIIVSKLGQIYLCGLNGEVVMLKVKITLLRANADTEEK